MDAFSDLAFFVLLMKHGSMARAAQELGVTPPSVSKRLAALEARLGVRLLQRTTRRIALTPEGETYVTEGSRVLAELDALERSVAGATAVPRGLLKINASFGFGRRHVAPALSRFVKRHPELQVQLYLSDRPASLVEQGFDAAIRFGELPDGRLASRRLAANARVLCASPAYLRRAGEPTHPRELAQHDCIFLREGDEPFGAWTLRAGSRTETVKVRGPLSSNDGEAALGLARDGHGIVMRSQWDAAAYFRSGRLRVVLPEWRPPAHDVHIVFPSKAHLSAKTRALVDWLVDWFAEHRDASEARPSW